MKPVKHPHKLPRIGVDEQTFAALEAAGRILQLNRYDTLREVIKAGLRTLRPEKAFATSSCEEDA